MVERVRETYNLPVTHVIVEAAAVLGSMLARSIADNLVVAAGVPTPWPPNLNRIANEYLALQRTPGSPGKKPL